MNLSTGLAVGGTRRHRDRRGRGPMAAGPATPPAEIDACPEAYADSRWRAFPVDSLPQ